METRFIQGAQIFKGTWTPPKTVLPMTLPVAFTTNLLLDLAPALVLCYYRAGFDREIIEMGFAMECN